ncbi:pyruvate dehydrogenase (acetyl-transferring) E1 component subunit alpha [Streptosporangium saharense]|uniref:Pyruvate dehydrogenase E1 component alpha subunit n=1 Tax=Streptosporangium saharense TaxID=1706840 RepID=A0A7W7VM54_9ACTN|nr:pyruvate dehydrogenase (acetyl-transferring) E1 component subunit alpha [Streptosporangium saharense]MBB4915268.1 pyruvate dehydrogenase E1 component alpha subunit [Streptosporangium saharense]
MTIDAARGTPRGTVAEPPPELVQLLTPDGRRVEHPDYDAVFTAQEVRSLYRDLVIVRRLDEEALALARQGELAVWPSLRGQEAAQVGSARALLPGDMAFPSYREHGVAWCRGVDPVRELGSFRGINHAGWDPREHNLHLPTIVIGSQVLHATGYAMGVQRDGAEDAVIAYFGDGATSEGDVNEAFAWAAVQNAPIVFFCQNNQWAISEPTERQSRVPLHRRADGFGFPGVRVDGNDVLACLAVTARALDDARSGLGPTLVEAFTYRMGAHTTTDDPGRYRPRAEAEAWLLKDPVDRVKTHLLSSGAADEAFLAEVEAEAARIGTDMRTRCRELPDPDLDELWDNVYAAEHPLVEDERARFAAYLASFEDVPR